MLRSEKGEMGLEERRILENLIRDGGRSFFLVEFLISIVLGLVFVALMRRVAGYVSLDIPVEWGVPTGLFLGCLIGIIWKVRLRRGEASSNKEYCADLEGGETELLEVDVHGVVKLEEFEDEGSGYFLDVGDSRILFLQGQYLYDLEEEKRFPNRKFDLRRAPNSKLVFDLKCRGEPLFPLRTLDPEKVEVAVPPDGTVFEGLLEEITESHLGSHPEG